MLFSNAQNAAVTLHSMSDQVTGTVLCLRLSPVLTIACLLNRNRTVKGIDGSAETMNNNVISPSILIGFMVFINERSQTHSFL